MCLGRIYSSGIFVTNIKLYGFWENKRDVLIFFMGDGQIVFGESIELPF